MTEKVVSVKLPVGARVMHREPPREKSLELAEQLARRGGSESLIRAVGGEEAVERFLAKDQPTEESDEEGLAHA